MLPEDGEWRHLDIPADLKEFPRILSFSCNEMKQRVCWFELLQLSEIWLWADLMLLWGIWSCATQGHMMKVGLGSTVH